MCVQNTSSRVLGSITSAPQALLSVNNMRWVSLTTSYPRSEGPVSRCLSLLLTGVLPPLLRSLLELAPSGFIDPCQYFTHPHVSFIHSQLAEAESISEPEGVSTQSDRGGSGSALDSHSFV